MDHELNKLSAFVAKHFLFGEETYPEMKGMTEEQRFSFALKHCALHFGKTAGKIIAVSEARDHGKKTDMEELRSNLSKSLINTLRVAELIGMSGREFIDLIEKKYKDKIE